MKFCTLIVFDLLNSKQLRAEADSQWGRRIGHFTMAATKKKYFLFTGHVKFAFYKKICEVLDITGAYLIVTTTRTDIV